MFGQQFGFTQVLEGFGSKMLYLLRFLKGFWWNSLVYQRFWKVWVSKRTSASKLFHFIIKSMHCEPFWSSGRPDALELPIHQFSLSNQCPGKHFRAQAPQSSWNITFHQQMDAISVREESIRCWLIRKPWTLWGRANWNSFRLSRNSNGFEGKVDLGGGAS